MKDEGGKLENMFRNINDSYRDKYSENEIELKLNFLFREMFHFIVMNEKVRTQKTKN